MDAKFVFCFEATSHDVWHKSFIASLRIIDSTKRSLRLYYDNSVTVFRDKNYKSQSQSKHIDTKYLTIREHVIEKKVIVEHINTK